MGEKSFYKYVKILMSEGNGSHCDRMKQSLWLRIMEDEQIIHFRVSNGND